MIKNYISENISYLVTKSKLSQDEFGETFDLKRGAINSYVRKIAIPKVETIQKICLHFEISIDDFVNLKLSELNKKDYVVQEKEIEVFQEPLDGFGMISLKYVETLENAIKDKDKLIKLLEEKIKPEKRKQA